MVLLLPGLLSVNSFSSLTGSDSELYTVVRVNSLVPSHSHHPRRSLHPLLNVFDSTRCVGTGTEGNSRGHDDNIKKGVYNVSQCTRELILHLEIYLLLYRTIKVELKTYFLQTVYLFELQLKDSHIKFLAQENFLMYLS